MSPPREEVAYCLLESPLGGCVGGRVTSLTAIIGNPASRPEAVRSAVNALAKIAERGDEMPLAALLVALGVGGKPVSDDVAMTGAVGLAELALTVPEFVVGWIDRTPVGAPARTALVDLLRDGFEASDDDFAEENFFATVRATYWSAPENSPTRLLMATFIQTLDF